MRKSLKLRVVSDLHLDFHKDGGKALVKTVTKGPYDILVVAGDLSEARSLKQSMLLLMTYAPTYVLYVPGNHDFYFGTREHTFSTLRQIEQEFGGRFVVLDNSVIYVMGQKFVGSTLWFPWDNPSPSDRFLGDFSHIHNFRDWLGNQEKESRRFLEDAISEDSVVITHHMPHPVCIHPRFAGNPLNRYFLHDLGNDLVRTPRVWIHGHTHNSVNMQMGDCHIVCNPFGYVGAENPSFRWDLDLCV
jgi:predicted phosphodiesterase